MNALALPAAAGVAADFSQDNGWVWLGKSVAILVFLLVSVLLAIWVERRIIARMQTRPGPNVHGPVRTPAVARRRDEAPVQGGHHGQAPRTRSSTSSPR